MKTIEEYAGLGGQYDVMQALELLTKAYIRMCGISLGFRTVVYCAAEVWMERLAWMDLPLSEKARKEPLIILMPFITSEYVSEYYDCYDITGMDEEELLAGCQQIIREKPFDEATLEVLCWGILKASKEMSPEKTVPSKEIETTAPDGTCLKGILMEQSLGATWIEMTSPYEGVNIDKMDSPSALIIEVPEGLNKPYSFQNVFYVRRGSMIHPADVYEIRSMLLNQQTTPTRWERVFSDEITADDFSQDELTALRKVIPFDDEKSFMEKMENCNHLHFH